MKITYDKSSDAVYIYRIYLSNNYDEKVLSTYCCDPVEVDGEINLDFNATGRLMGIEILDASQMLSPELLNKAQVIG